jgi:hypothetical protein
MQVLQLSFAPSTVVVDRRLGIGPHDVTCYPTPVESGLLPIVPNPVRRDLQLACYRHEGPKYSSRRSLDPPLSADIVFPHSTTRTELSARSTNPGLLAIWKDLVTFRSPRDGHDGRIPARPHYPIERISIAIAVAFPYKPIGTSELV